MARSNRHSSPARPGWHLPALITVLIALALRVWFVLSMRSYPLFEPLLPGYDMTVFHEWGRRIAAGQLTAGEAFYQAPLYPYLLGALYAVSGANVLAAALFQALLGSASVGLVYLIGLRLWGRPAGLTAAGLMAVTPIFPFYEVFTLWSSLATFLNLSFLAALVCYDPRKPLRRAALAGFLLGLAALCWASALILLAAGAWTIWRELAGLGKTRPAAAAVFVLASLVTISPATVHNRLAGGRWALVSTNFDENWKIGNSYDSSGGFSYPEQGLMPLFSVDFLRLQLKKALMLISDYEQPNNLNFYQIAAGRSWLGLIPLSWGFYLAFGLAGIILTWSQRRKLFPLYAYLVLYGGVLVAFFVLSRFRVPLWPVLILFTAAGFLRAAQLGREHRLAETAAVMVPAAVAWLILAFNNPRTIQPQYFDNLILVHLERGDTTAVIGELERGLEHYPDRPQTLWELAYYLQKEGRDAEAARYLERLAARAGERPELLREAGLLDLRLGLSERGAKRLARYLELAPQAPDSQKIAEIIGTLQANHGGP